MDWTVDTCVLYMAAEVELEAMYLLLRIMRQAHRVGMDHEGHIEHEYRQCLQATGDRLVEKWLRTVANSLAFMHSGKLDRRHRNALERLRFDRDDWPFVGVCSRTSSKNLVSEDSDYTEEVRAYLAHEMSVSVLSVGDAAKITD